MRVYQIKLKLFCLKDIEAYQIQSKVTTLLDKGFMVNDRLLELHEKNRFKGYTYDNPWPLEKDKKYKKGKIYTLTIRTIDPELAVYFSEICPNQYTDDLKGLMAEIRVLPKKRIQSLYTLTSAILKDSKHGYWRTHMSLADYENRLKVNLIKKWNTFQNEKINEDFQLYTLLEFLNEEPIPVSYKNIVLLGDKIRLQIADNEQAQQMAYMALGTGLLEHNSRGSGFVNYRWL